MRDVVGPFDVDGRWFCEHGEAQVDASNSNLISIGTASDKQVTIVRRGFRAGKYVLTYRFQWISGTRAGPLVRWVNPGDWIAVQLFHSDGKARLSKREADGNVTQLVTGTNSVSLTNNNWYTGRVVVGDDLGNSALQRLRFWVDTDDDGDFADETALLDTTTIDDVWSAGHVGLFRGSVSNAQDFDDFEAGLDNNADLDIADGGDEVVVDDDFATNVISPAYDNNGNLTDDGVNKHVYDGWNRHVKSTWRIKSPPSAVVAYEHDGSNRRVSKVVTNSGVENTSNDGGNTTQEYLFANGRLVEERNGSNQLVRAYMWQDNQLVWFEANGDPTIGNDSNPDLTATGEGSESVADKRYFHHADHRGRSSALTDYVSGGGSANGRIAERFEFRQLDLVTLTIGDSGSGERGAIRLVTLTGIAVNRFDADQLDAESVPGDDPPPPEAVPPRPEINPCYRSLKIHRYSFGADNWHIGLQIEPSWRGNPPKATVDYGPGSCPVPVICCNNTRITQPAGDIMPQSERSISCKCAHCLENCPNQCGPACNYTLLGTPPYTNSNSAVHACLEWCKLHSRCKIQEVKFGAIDDGNAPGWDGWPRCGWTGTPAPPPYPGNPRRVEIPGTLPTRGMP